MDYTKEVKPTNRAHKRDDLTNASAYLFPEERTERSKRKRAELVERELTPHWFVKSNTLNVPPDTRVGIIGAGFAGLSAASYLNECGVHTITYEARDVVGGRVRTNRSFVQGKTVEDGAELIGENHPLWGLLAQKHGLKLEPLADYEAANLKNRTRFVGKDLTPEQEAALHRNLIKHFASIGSKAREIDEVEPWCSTVARAADEESIEDMLDKMFGKELSLERRWFNFNLANDNCADVSKQSSLALLASVSAARMGSDVRGMMGYWLSSETHRCAGGNDLLATRLSEQLPDLRLRTVVKKINIDPGKQRAVQITSTEYDEQGKRIRELHDEVDYVVQATPPSVWSAIDVTPAHRHAFRTVQHGPAVKYKSRYDGQFWEVARLAPTTKSDGLGAVWEGTENQGNKPPFNLTVFSGGPYVQPASAYADKLAELYPPQEPSQGIPTGQQFIDWPNEPYIQTGYAVPAVGEVTGIFPNQTLPHAERMYFAGEHTSPGFFGYMEGALQSGARAGRDIMKDILKTVLGVEIGETVKSQV